ncbi:hypothetical protein M2266_004362 [Streptomyces sp. SPB162]|nr:hypothetical protein [Streptomyces sp. SPB162]
MSAPTVVAPVVSSAVPPAAGPSGVALLGVRHHGPGSARAVRAALDAYRPRAVLIEGPPEADVLVGLAGEEGMRPPVALLAHVLDDPARAAFWPFAEFSPEWVAIRWAAGHGVPVTFIDLPAAHSLALRTATDQQGGGEEDEKAQALRIDPLAVLAEAAGYDDPERWWEDAVEHRSSSGEDPLAPFAALAEAMGALRELYGDGGGQEDDPAREAHMRLRVRDARRTHDRVAVVCGAWHVPALARPVTVTADRQLLKGLPKVRVEMTWVPWTHRRLSRHSGYGAGIDSPGWYGHLFAARDRPVTRWMTKVAGLLRAEDLPVSSAHVIEAVRLADSLASLRGRPLAGLSETTDAIRAVMCDGSDAPLALIRDRLVVGDVLGEVPDGAPAVPLARDLVREQRRLRLKPEALERDLELDLRKETDAGRSRLLHRLRLLGVDWGEQVSSRGGTGTFKESWRLRWEPELAIRVAEAGIWGTTLLSAATAKAEEAAVRATALADVTALAERCLVAGLPDALPVVMRVLADRGRAGDRRRPSRPGAARSRPVRPLRRCARYGLRGAPQGRRGSGGTGLRRAAARLRGAGRGRRRRDARPRRGGAPGDRPPGGRQPPRPVGGDAAGHRRAGRGDTGAAARQRRPPADGRRTARRGGRRPVDGARPVAGDTVGRGRGVAGGLPRGQRHAPRPRRAAARPGRRLARGGPGRRVRRRAAASAAHVQRVRKRRPPHRRRVGRPRCGGPARGLRRGPRCRASARTSTRSGRRRRCRCCGFCWGARRDTPAIQGGRRRGRTDDRGHDCRRHAAGGPRR